MTERAGLLSAVYLVLPELPEEEPDWIQALNRVSIAPQEEDITFLLNVLEHANVVDLVRIGRGGQGVPVVVRPDYPSALPIAPQYLRRALTDVREQWFAYIGTANGRLNNGMFGIPPDDYVMDIFALNLEEVGILPEGETFTAHEAWPFIVSSLSVNGTAGPYWFLVRRTTELGQLRVQIEHAIRIGPAYLRNRREEILQGLDSILRGRSLTTQISYVRNLVNAGEESELRRERLSDAVGRNVGTNKELSREASSQVLLASQGDISVGRVLLKLVENELGVENDGAKNYWARMLSEASHEEEDIPALLAVLRTPSLNQAHTGAKKAIRLIDFLSNGPSVEIARNDI